MHLKPLIIITLLCCIMTLAEAQNSTMPPTSEKSEGYTTEKVLYFRYDRYTVDADYRNNRQTLTDLHALIAASPMASRIDSIRIHATASPEGSSAHNASLASMRARSLKNYLLQKYPHLSQKHVSITAHAESWDVLRLLATTDNNMPDRDEVLQILALNVPHEQKGFLLKKLDAGIPYKYISTRLLPNLHNEAVCTVYARPLMHPHSARPAVDVASLATTTGAGTSQEKCRITNAEAGKPTGAKARPRHRKERRRTLFALKTNLLFDAALMPNVEVEAPLGKRWSVNAEYTFPWWLSENNKYCLEILMGGLEARCWLGKRNKRDMLTGHFMGLYASMGKYDLQWEETGYQGEFYLSTGLSYGYACRIARRLNLEFSIGIGMMRTGYRHYRTTADYRTLLWQKNGNYTWLGPTKAKIALVWLIGGKRMKTYE